MASAGGGPALTTVNPDSAYPEGPTVIDGVLYYAEMGNDRVMRFDGATNAPVWTRDGCGPTTVAPLGDGSLAVLCHREAIVARISIDGTLLGIVDRDRDGRAFTNPNAGTSDGKGGIYFSSSGSFSPGARATGAILHLDASGALTRVAEGIHYANGVAISPDGRTLYRLGASGTPRARLRHRRRRHAVQPPHLRRRSTISSAPIPSGAGRSVPTGSMSTATAT